MKISDIRLDDIIAFLKYDEYDLTPEEKSLLTVFLSSAKEYVRSYTGLTQEECDRHEDLTSAVFILTADFYENRSAYLEGNKATPSKTLEDILGFYQVNLI